MSRQKCSDFYRQGLNPVLDKKLAEYRKLRPFVGDAHLNVLTETEIDKMAKLWWKEKSASFRLTILEVTTLLAGLLLFLMKNVLNILEMTRVHLNLLKFQNLCTQSSFIGKLMVQEMAAKITA